MNNTMRNKLGDIEFEVRARLGIIETYQTGWSKELNIICWNGGVPKYDIRDWNPDHSQMSKGITLHEAEAQKLRELLDARFTRPAVKGHGWNTAIGAEAVERERREALAVVQANHVSQAKQDQEHVAESSGEQNEYQQATDRGYIDYVEPDEQNTTQEENSEERCKQEEEICEQEENIDIEQTA